MNLETLASEAELHADTCVRTKGRLRLHGRAKEQDPRSPWIVTPRAVRWLKVEGKLERRGTGTVLKASKVALATPRD